jgi:hypothetical protein
LRRNIRSSPQDAKAYNTYVRPSVEYASSVWSPAADSHINQLEMVQRRAAWFVKNDYKYQSSVNLVKSLHRTTLQKRRDMARVNMLYKIKHDLVDVTTDPALCNARTSRGNPQQLSQLTCKKSVYQNSFFPATIILWNRLPIQVVEKPTLEGFKSALMKHYTTN